MPNLSKLALAISGLLVASSLGAQIPAPPPAPAAADPKAQEAGKARSTVPAAAVKRDVAPPRLPPLPSAFPQLPGEEFEAVRSEVAPLSPEQIRQMRQLIDAAEKAQNDNLRSPRSVSYSLPVNLSPGAQPPVFRVSNRHISSVVFLDSTGAPWPIAGITVGDAPRFEVKRDGPPHTITINSKFTYGETNVAVFLTGLATPLNIVLIAGQREVDTRVDLTVPGRGPNANVTTAPMRAVDADPMLINFLDGIVPSDAKSLSVKGGNASAWRLGGRIYLRTRLSILSPAWRDSLSSSDGTVVYSMPEAPVVLASVDGKVVNLSISGE